MTVRVDRLVTDVSTGAETPAEDNRPAEDARWDQRQHLEQMWERRQYLIRRTCAEGFDD